MGAEQSLCHLLVAHAMPYRKHKTPHHVLLTKFAQRSIYDGKASHLRFDPDRWADDAANKKKHRRAFTPFATGPRGCVGFNVEKLDAKLALANLVYRYYFTDADTEPMQYGPESLVIRSLNCYARARKRTS